MRVLIADDDRTSIIRLRRTLQQMGYEVHSASNGTEALRALQEPSAPQLAIQLKSSRAANSVAIFSGSYLFKVKFQI